MVLKENAQGKACKDTFIDRLLRRVLQDHPVEYIWFQTLTCLMHNDHFGAFGGLLQVFEVGDTLTARLRVYGRKQN